MHLLFNFALLDSYWEERRLTLVNNYYVPGALSFLSHLIFPREARRRVMLKEMKLVSPMSPLGLGTEWNPALLEDSPLWEGRWMTHSVPDIWGPIKNHSEISFYQVGGLRTTHQGGV